MGKFSSILSWKKRRQPVSRDGGHPLGSLEHKIQVCQAYLAVWQKLFQFIATSLADKKILPEQEREFARIVYQSAYEHFKFTKLMGSGFSGTKKIMQILDKCPSLSQLKVMPEASFGALQVEWHEVFLAINKTLGHLIAQRPVDETAAAQKGKTPPPQAPGAKGAPPAPRPQPAPPRPAAAPAAASAPASAPSPAPSSVSADGAPQRK